jgi:TP901 family phage tail tape measure protein
VSNEHVIDAKVRADTTNFHKGMSDVEKDLDKAGQGFSKYGSEAEKASQQSQGFVESNKANMESLGKDAMILGGAILLGIGVAVKAYSEFSGRMAQVASLSHASAAEMDILTTSALTMGTAFGLSANDVADAEIELVKAGVSVKEMMGGALPGALALAAAGQIDVGKATEIATIALTQFKLEGKDVPHVADLLAAGADKALGGVSELGDALKQGGLIASNFGLTIDDTVGTLSAFANAGLLGSDAGTSMKTMFLALANPSKEASNIMAQYGINAYNTKNEFIGVTALAGQLKDKLGPLGEEQRNAALATIFGTDAMRSAVVLMKEGSSGIQQWIKDVNDQGFAATQAAGKMNSLNGDFKKLQAAVQTGLIQMGAAADGFARPVVQGLTDAITAFNGLPEPVKGGIMAVAGITGAGLLMVGMILTAIPKIHETISAVNALATAAPRLAEGLKTVGKSALIATGLLIALKVASDIRAGMEGSAKSTEEMSQQIIKLNANGAKAKDVFNKDMFASSNGRALVEDINGIGEALKSISKPDWIDGANDVGNVVLGALTLGAAHVNTQLDKTKESVKNIDGALANFVSSGNSELAANSFKRIAEEGKAQGLTMEETVKVFPQYMDSLRGLARQMEVGLTDQELMNWALGEVPQKMKDAASSTEGQAKAAEIAAKQTEAQQKALDDLGISAGGAILNLDKLVTSMIASGLISLSARDAARNFEAAVDALDESIKTNGTTLDTNTEKGRANEAAFDAISGAGLRSAEAMAKNGASNVAVQANLKGTYDALIAAAGKFGITGQAADDMARDVMGIPKDVPIETSIQNYADTMAKALAIKRAVEAIASDKTIYFHTDASGFYDPSAGTDGKGAGSGGAARGPKAFAEGGAIEGRGPKGVDRELILAAHGEHVLDTSDVDAMGGQQGVYAFRRALHDPGARALQYAAPAPPQRGGGTYATPTLSLDGYTLKLNADATLATFVRIADGAASSAIRDANDDLYRGRAR